VLGFSSKICRVTPIVGCVAICLCPWVSLCFSVIVVLLMYEMWKQM
jgi:hypothetical protein